MTEPFVRPDVRAHLDAAKANLRPKMTVEGLVAGRPRYVQYYATIDLPVGDLAVTRDILIPGPGGQIPLRIFDARASHGLDTADRQWLDSLYKPQRGHWRATPLVAGQTGMPPTLVLTAALDPLRDEGRAYAAKTIAAGVPTTYMEASGTIHAFVSLRKAIPSGKADFLSALETAQLMLQQSLAVRS